MNDRKRIPQIKINNGEATTTIQIIARKMMRI